MWATGSRLKFVGSRVKGATRSAGYGQQGQGCGDDCASPLPPVTCVTSGTSLTAFLMVSSTSGSKLPLGAPGTSDLGRVWQEGENASGRKEDNKEDGIKSMRWRVGDKKDGRVRIRWHVGDCLL